MKKRIKRIKRDPTVVKQLLEMIFHGIKNVWKMEYLSQVSGEDITTMIRY